MNDNIQKKSIFLISVIILFICWCSFQLNANNEKPSQKHQKYPSYKTEKKSTFPLKRNLVSGKIHDPSSISISKMGEWGTGYYEAVFIKGNYAYCAATGSGLDIIDISNPSNPVKIGNQDTSSLANDVHVSGKYALVADSDSVEVIDVSNPRNPSYVDQIITNSFPLGVFIQGDYAYIADAWAGLTIVSLNQLPYITEVGDCDTSGYARDVYVYNNHAYIADDTDGLQVIDVSNPYSPKLVGNCNTTDCAMGVYVDGNYAYLASFFGGLEIIDVSDPANPSMVGNYKSKEIDASYDVSVDGNYAFVGVGKGLNILDISDPTSPSLSGSVDVPGLGVRLHHSGNNVYLANYCGGLHIIDVSNRTRPVEISCYDQSCFFREMEISGNYAYIADDWYGMQIIDISNPASPKCVGDFNSSIAVEDVSIKGKYAYLTDVEGVKVINISNPRNPTQVGEYTQAFSSAIEIMGDYAYIISNNQLMVLNISNPATPYLMGSFDELSNGQDLFVEGNYAYIADSVAGFIIIDISSPSLPYKVSNCYNGFVVDVFIKGQYAYLVEWKGLRIYDISTPKTPILKGTYSTQSLVSKVCVNGDYAFLGSEASGLEVLDISSPTNPTFLKSFHTPGIVSSLIYKDPYLYVADGLSGQFFIYSTSSSDNPQLGLSRDTLNFSTEMNGITTPSQSLIISNKGKGVLNWTLSADQTWLQCTPTSGGNSEIVTVSIATANLSPGTHTGSITVTDPNATNSPQTVSVRLNVYQTGQTSAPFGEFATPIDQSTVSSSIPVTGWVLDDIGVENVRIFRGNPGSLTYIGDAVFVEGARPDIEQAYPDYPMNYRAGWGYMLLSNFLPNGGNGTFNIYAKAIDTEGNEISLGSKTIYCDNANAVKPFGAIDTPNQGGIASGSSFVNWGWALTPQPNIIPTDGSTINVWVDGLNMGHPTYNKYREDIATLFPGYNNSNGAIGIFYLDTTGFENGVHTISWTATDSAGNTDGIGSRYFAIQNLTGNTTLSSKTNIQAISHNLDSIMKLPVNKREPSQIKQFQDENKEPKIVFHDENGIQIIRLKELENLEIKLTSGSMQIAGYTISGNRLSSLPIGSTLKNGHFYWAPGPGFIGGYRLVFTISEKNNKWTRKEFMVKIEPRFSNRKRD